MGKLIDLTGKTFGLLTVTGLAPRKKNTTMWHCRCECGKEVIARAPNLSTGNSKSCGCLSSRLASQRNAKHRHCSGYKSSKVYQAWQNIRARCLNPSNNRFIDYGGRGITVCDRWLVFENFLADMGEPPSPKHSIDRIDNNGNYAPENCRWVENEVQIRNRRSARLLTFQGRTQNLCDWAKELNMKQSTLAARLDLYRMTVEEALTKPLHRRSRPWVGQT